MLIERSRTSHDPQILPDLIKSILIELLVLVATHNRLTEVLAVPYRSLGLDVVDDAALFGNGSGGDHVVARHHTHRDAGPFAFHNGRWHFITHRIFDAHEANHDEILFNIFDVGIGLIAVLVSQDNSAQSLLCHRDDHCILRLFIAHDFYRAIGHQPVSADSKDHFGSTLAIDAVFAVGELDAGAHPLARRGERKLLIPIGVVGTLASDLPVRLLITSSAVIDLGTAILKQVGHHQQTAFRIIAGVHRSLHSVFAVEIGFRHAVNHRSVLQELLHRVLDGHFRHVIAHAANVDFGNGHTRGGERACLVRADSSCTAHRLTRRQMAYKIVVLEHFAHGKGQRNRDCQRQPLWHCYHKDGDARD
mmetsp:Transcript_11973/g.17250  ORF Transcript_11973/g.17250 Transcript_11973/m.17250 type:complete len:362 (+) Transcript_11973:1193-2278(+)